MEKIEPTTILAKEDDSYKLEDRDYLLIKAIRDLTRAIERSKNGR